MKTKTTHLQIRLTELQREDIKRRSVPFGNMSFFVLQAIKEFSDTTAKDKLETCKLLAERYAAIDMQLGHVGGNLNQAMHRVNEYSAGGVDYAPILINSVLPEIQKCQEICVEIRKMLREVTIKFAK